MKRIRTITLVLRTGRERIYEIDLIDLERDAPERFLVNYRYGWTGKELQEGTRTPDPVTEDEAEKIFDSLVLSRRNQGYGDASGAEAWSGRPERSSEPQAVEEGVTHPRSARLLYLLGNLASFPDNAAAKLIWRTGQTRLAVAAPILAAYVRDAQKMACRVLPYALYRCGREKPETILPALEYLSRSDDLTVKTSAEIALSLLSSNDAEAGRIRAQLPAPVLAALEDGNLDAAATKILDYLAIAIAAAVERAEPTTNGAEQQKALLNLYLLSHHAPQTRPLFLKVLNSVPFQPFIFRAVRRIFKAAEAVDDAAVFAVFCQRFDVERPSFRYGYGRMYVPALGKYMGREVFETDDARVAWTDHTKAYFRRRIWRHLRRLGALEDQTYVDLAAACLLTADEENEPSTSKTKWLWSRPTGYTQTQIHFPAMSRRYAIHKILHGNGARLSSSGGRALNWRFTAADQADAATREEPFAQLWDAVPERVLSLLLNATAEQVHAFAARILGDNRAFRLALPVSQLAQLLTTPGKARFTFAYETVSAQFAEGQLSGDIIPALFIANRHESIELGKTVLNARPDLITASPTLAAEFILAAREETKDWMSEFWAKNAASANALATVEEVIDQLRALPWDAQTLGDDKKNIRVAASLLAEHFKAGIAVTPLASFVELSRSEEIPPQLMAILLAAARPDGLTAFDPRALAESHDEDIQAAAAELLANAGIEELRNHEDLIAAFLVAPVERARKLSRNAAIAIANEDAEAAKRLARKLLDVLFRAEEYEGVRDDAVETMQGPLLEAVRSEGPDLTWSLLRARSEPARRVGAASLESFAPNAFSLRKIARLGNNDQVKARHWALKAIDSRMEEVRTAPQNIFALLDGEWDDSREAAYELIRNRLAAEDWSPEAVVGLCDCTTLPAQKFGREILGKMFSKEHSEFFLLRLSEHPAAGFRLTIARLIREYASGDAARLRKVEPAMRTILSRVFSSRAAKEQIHKLIETEIERGDPETLAVLAGLLETVSATCAVADKARILEHIVRLKAKQPDLVSEAALIAPQLRGSKNEEAATWK